MPPAPSGPPDRGTVARRDAGLRRVSRLTRWLLAGALALTAAFSTIAARSGLGQSGSHSTSSSSGVQSSDDSGSAGSSSSDDSGTDTTLQSPASSPSASGGDGGVTSGGS